MKALLPALGFSAIAALFSLGASMAPPERGEMAVAFPPFTNQAQAYAIVAEAGGHVVGPTKVPGMVVAYAGTSDFQDRARALGALFFTKASGLCSPIAT